MAFHGRLRAALGLWLKPEVPPPVCLHKENTVSAVTSQRTTNASESFFGATTKNDTFLVVTIGPNTMTQG